MTNQKQTPKNPFLKMHKASYLMIAATMIITASIFLSPVFSQSTNPCAPCHGLQAYYQSLDILEETAGNTMPTTLTVGQTATVTIAVENNVNTTLFATMSDVSLTLNSENGHISVNAPTINIGTLQKGTATATWQITGTSAGSDTLIITATGKNQHQSLSFSDNYAPAPSISVIAPTATPAPTTAPTPTSKPTTTTPQTPAPTTTNPQPSTPKPTTPTPDPSTSPAPTSSPKNESSNSPEEQNNQRALKIWFTNPREGETWNAGNKKTVEWITSGGAGNFNIKLELRKSGASGPWSTLAENLPNSNNFVWNVSNLDANNYIIRATVTDSANPPQTASVTVAAKIAPSVHLYAAIMISSIPIVLPMAILTALIIKRRLTQTQTSNNKNMPS